MEIRKAYTEDFEKVYEILKNLKGSGKTKADWSKLFSNHWETDENYFGYTLFDKNKAVGFIGTIFSKRYIQGREYKFCNLTSWIVEKDYRHQSLSLLSPILKLKDYIITDHTATKEVCLIEKSFGFKELDCRCRIINPIPKFSFRSAEPCASIVFDQDIIKKHLRADELKIFYDHRKLNCVHILIMAEFENCYMIVTRVTRKKMPWAYVHFISNLNVFLKCIDAFKFAMMKYLKVVSVIIDERFLQNCVLPHTIKYPLRQPKLFKSSSLEPHQIDNLYSEIIIFNF